MDRLDLGFPTWSDVRFLRFLIPLLEESSTALLLLPFDLSDMEKQHSYVSDTHNLSWNLKLRYDSMIFKLEILTDSHYIQACALFHTK